MAKMVKRILEQESAIRVVLSTDRKVSHLVPTWQDIDVLKSIDRALSPLSSLTDILSGDTYVTISAVLPMLQLIESSILKEEEEDTNLTKEIKRRIIFDLKGRYPEFPDSDAVLEILQLATFLDPRFKTNFEDLELEHIKETVIAECTEIAETSESILHSGSGRSATLEPPTKKKNLGSLFKKHDEQDTLASSSCSSPRSTDEICREELQAYLVLPKLDFEENPLVWWKATSSHYPLLSKMARKYLSVCATSSPSERLFSSSGKIVTPLRACMKPHKVDMLTFLTNNL